MPIVFQIEPAAAVHAEILPLADRHWREVEAALYGGEHVIDIDLYTLLERRGAFALITARDDADGSLQGYAAFVLTDKTHCKNILAATCDALYLSPAHRGGLAVLRMLRFAETLLKERGVTRIQYSSPASRDCGAIFRRLGARMTETVYLKDLA